MNTYILSGRYRVLHSLASGGMGQTFIAEDTQLPGNPQCVVKQLKPASGDASFLATAKRLFLSEAETLQQLGTHDQIPRLLAYFEENDEFYLVQDYIEGYSLSQEMPLGQRWAEAQVIQLLQDILEVLSFVHHQKVIHRDIKPDNIIRRDVDRKLVLIDFGAVKQIQSQPTALMSQMSSTVAIGTHGYMPTEQISGKPRMSSDLYAVGKIAIQALTGLLPTQLHEDADGEIIWRDQADVSNALADFLTKMVRDYHKLRYQTADEALQALRSLKSVRPSGYAPTQASLKQDNTATIPVQGIAHPQTAVSPQAHQSNSNGSNGSAPSNANTSSTVVASPVGPSASPTPPTSNNNRNTLIMLVLGAFALFGPMGGILAYNSYLNQSNRAAPENTPTEQAPVASPDSTDSTDSEESPPELAAKNSPDALTEDGPTEDTPTKTESKPDEPDDSPVQANNPFQQQSFPQAECGDSSVNKPFYRVYVRNPNLLTKVKTSYCQDAFLEKKTNRVKVAAFDTQERATQFQAYIEKNVGSVDIDTVSE